MGRVEGKVALITGAARGQGRSHAVRLAEEGADIVAVDICHDIDTIKYHMGTAEELAETAALVEKLGKRIITREVDIRDQAGLDSAVADAYSSFGRLDIVSANAGVASYGFLWELSEAEWQETIDVMLTGAWHTLKAVSPAMIEAGNGGAITITSSVAALVGAGKISHYAAAKAGILGLMHTAANELAPHSIRVNAIAPGNVETELATNEFTRKAIFPAIENPTQEQVNHVLRVLHALPVTYVQPVDISNALLWLSSDEARYVTGVLIPVDAGWMIN
jgi:(+)-trans-carveol dehydrogenase